MKTKGWDCFNSFKERGEWVELMFMAAAYGYHVLKLWGRLFQIRCRCRTSRPITARPSQIQQLPLRRGMPLPIPPQAETRRRHRACLGTKCSPKANCRRHRSRDLRFIVETELETDGRWIAEIPQMPGAMAYSATKEKAITRLESSQRGRYPLRAKSSSREAAK